MSEKNNRPNPKKRFLKCETLMYFYAPTKGKSVGKVSWYKLKNPGRGKESVVDNILYLL